ncbi:RDD family protein [Streptomyces sp. NPDC046716]|uniref:RDD family protein n=1 Tax=Streptomyces sp. NPDC046716 TaxID=3157093 RepID=UPI003408B6FD
MSAPTPAPGDDRPREGYYPDPSIPGYVRYWNGAAWVPGTSRPAPSDGEQLPAPPGASAQPGPPAQQSAAPAEETGPVFLDEEPSVRTETGPETGAVNSVDAPAPPEPASAWQADASRQSGFGGEQDRRISWGSPDSGPAAPEPAAEEPQQRPDSTVSIRAVRPGAAAPVRTEGTMAIRALPKQQTPPTPAPAPAPTPAPAPAPQQPQPQQAQQPQAGYGYPPQQQQPQQQQQQQSLPTPVTQGPGGGQPSWAQQVHQLATPNAAAAPESGGPVTPFKPVANDPFLAAAQAQASARPAGLGKRFAARLIDSVVLGAVTAAAAVPLYGRAVDHLDGKIDAAKASGRQVTVWLIDGTTGVYLGIVLGVLLVFGVLYEALPTAKWGRTLGKKVLGLSVRDIEEHSSPTFGAALKRWLAYSVPGVLVIGVLGVLWGAFDRPWRQCLHDKAARTFVAD